MAGIRLGVAVIMAAAGGLAAAMGSLGVRSSGSGGAFGGSAPVHIAHVGRIEVDLGSAAAGGLRRIACAGAASATVCYVASSSRSH